MKSHDKNQSSPKVVPPRPAPTEISDTLPKTLSLSPLAKQTWQLPQSSATSSLAKLFAQTLIGTENILVSGPMGVGKSFFIRQVLRTLGVEELSITSPTFTLMHPYEVTTQKKSHEAAPGTSAHTLNLLHVDLYRLLGQKDSALESIGLLEKLTQNQLIFIEWGEDFSSLQPHIDYHLTFSSLVPTSLPPKEDEVPEHSCHLTAHRLR